MSIKDNNMKPTIIDAIKACQEENNPNVQFTINYESLESIIDLSGMQQFRGPDPEPGPLSFTFEDVLSKKDKLEAEYEAQTYARDRATAYPSTGDQLDMIYKDMKNSTTTHADAVEAVKTKYPKG